MAPADTPSFPAMLAPKKRIRYKTRAMLVVPSAARETFADARSCFFVVSLDSHQFAPAKVESMAQWISSRFKQCIVLVGDGIHRITLEAKLQLSPDAAVAEALRKGDEFIGSTSEIFERLAGTTEFEVLRCSEVQTWGSYEGHYRILTRYFQADSKFRESVEAAARKYHGRQSRMRLGKIECKRSVRSSCEYFLEEFAVFACMQQMGIPVMIYPGPVDTLREIIAGEHVDAPPELKGLTFVSLDLKRR